jgi:YVTN family beta-propeller protein
LNTLDCRGKSAAESGAAIIARFNAVRTGERFEARMDDYATNLRMGLLEAGARHRAAREDDGSWRLVITRGRVPAQGSMPGVHHVVAANGSVWTCERAERVARIDADTRALAAVRAVAKRASHLALDERAGRLFVADAGAGKIIALRAADLAEVAHWNAPGMPQLPLVSTEGIVCVTGGVTGTVTLAWPSGGGYRQRTIDVGAAPHDPAFDGDGTHLFVPCAGSGELVKLRLSDASIVGRIAVGDGPSHLALHPDGERLYSTNSWDGTVSCVGTDGRHIAQARSGGWAHAIEVSRDGARIFVANFLDDAVSVLDAHTLDPVATLDTEAYPHGLDLSPDGSRLIATGFGSDHVRVFDALELSEVARVGVGWGSSHSAFASDGGAWIGCSVSDHLARVDLQSLTCGSRLHLSRPSRHGLNPSNGS